MKSSSKTVLAITTSQGPQALSKAQLKFNQLMKKIAGQKQRLQEWQEAIPSYRERLVKDYQPRWEEFCQRKKDIIKALELAYADKKLKKGDKDKVRDLICLLSADLLIETEDEELKEIYNRYSDVDFDSMMAEEKKLTKAMIETMMGVDLDDTEIDSEGSPDDVMEQLLEAAARKKAESDTEPPPARKKSKKQLLNEARQEAAAQEVSQSIREVFRKLAASLHPDREPDEQERLRKTELMKCVNIAYENKDLLTLLNLQLEIEQINQQHINTLSEVRLKHYIKVLQDQSAELQYELRGIEENVMAMLGKEISGTITPKKAMEGLREKISLIQQYIFSINRDLIALKDAANVKAWLRVNYAPLMGDNVEEDYI